MTCEVYVGAAHYAAGTLLPIEHGIPDPAICASLRAGNHGANTYAHHASDILELAEAAMRACLAGAALRPAQIDAVFLVSSALDARNNLDPAWLGDLNERLELDQAVHYHIGITGCGGFHWAARLAAGLVGAGSCSRILVVCFDQAAGPLQRLYGEGTSFTYVTGDAAAACVIGNSADGLDYRLLGQVVNLYDGKQIARPSIDSEIETISRLFQKTYEQAGLSPRDIDAFITNNYSLDISRLYCQLAGLPFAKAWTSTIATHAHCFSADNLINLSQLTAAGGMKDGDTALLFSTGPIQWGACVLQKLPRSTERAC